jgi:hypothetical protein
MAAKPPVRLKQLESAKQALLFLQQNRAARRELKRLFESGPLAFEDAGSVPWVWANTQLGAWFPAQENIGRQLGIAPNYSSPSILAKTA